MKFLIFAWLIFMPALSGADFQTVLIKALNNETLNADESRTLTKLVLRKHDQMLQLIEKGLPGKAGEKAKALLPVLTAPASEDKGANRLGAAVGWFIEYQGNDMTSFPLVTEVKRDSPAAKAKLTAGDVISKIAGESLHHHQSRNHLIHLLMIWPEDTPMKMEVRFSKKWNEVKYHANRRKKRNFMRKAFLLGAGLGTRLRPMTNTLPKPLIPFANRPLMTHVLDHCIAAGINDFAINTHHLHEEWDKTFPDGTYRGAKLTFFHEPELLETGGGIKNIADWIGQDPVLVYNGDIITDLPIERLITGHMASNNVATLAVQDHGPSIHITVEGHQVTDIRGKVHGKEDTHQFTGIYCIDPEILDLIPPDEKISVIPAFIELIRRGELGAYHVKGTPRWLDLGTRASYLEASAAITPEIHENAEVSGEVTGTWVGSNSVVEKGAVVTNSILWPGARVLADARLTNCIVHSTSPVSGVHADADL